MTPSPFLLQLAILLLPGVIWAHMDSQYAARSKPSQVEFIVRSLLFGLASYAVTYGIFIELGWQFEFVDLEKVADASVLTQQIVKQIGWATFVGFLLSVGWLYGSRYKLLTRFLQRIRATNAFGDEDVWDFTLNSRDAASEYVNFRDLDNQLVYSGYVGAFSESGKMREMVLTEVEVFNFEGQKLFEIPRVYLAQKADNIHMEFPYVPEEPFPRKPK
ncbi:DUF6338 family protein [Mesorhizobium sp. dw_380]|uniref:DUF6338 family protein n=1 Tax=Mesorhizobium sp. dw_380 TaxID=2812001 RepID=UPI0025497827|nr:DUF6338 family protein [Mesorhizobium sp. dw_380]